MGTRTTRLINKLPGLLLLLLLHPSGVFGQKAIPDTTRFLIGSQINLTFELPVKQGTLVNWPVFGDTLTRNFEIISVDGPDTLRQGKGDDLLLRQVVRITSFDTGFHVLPPVAFAVKEAGAAGFSDVYTEPLLLEVVNVEVDMSADIRDLKPLMKAPYTFRDFLPYILGLLGLGLVILFIWYYLENRKKHKPLIKLPVKPQRPPHLVALEKLDALKREQLWQSGRVKEYYTKLTDILREYFHLRFNVDAMEMTSDEILSAMRDYLTDNARLSDLQKIFSLSDMAKFAKARPLGADNELSHTLAVAIVNSTSPAPAVQEPASKTETAGDDLKTTQNL